VASLTQRPLTEFRSVFPDYFTAMDIPLLRGRGFTEEDRLDGQSVVIVNEALVQQHWPGEDPVGKQIAFWGVTREIVGVAANTLDVGQTPRPMTFMSVFQNPRSSMSFTIRTAGEPSSIVESVRTAVLGLDPSLPIYRVMSMEDVMSEQRGGDTIMAKIMAVLALVALVLAVVGVYGVMAYSVSQRTREMGIRMALGAQRGKVLALVMRQGATLAAIGVVIGIGIALLVTRSLATFLFGVSPFDPVAYSTISLVLLGASVGATYLPARRATQVDPLEALRTE
jgi:predicted permease